MCGSYLDRGVVHFTCHGISRTDTVVKSISFTQQIGMKSGIKLLQFCALTVWTSIIQPCSDRKLMTYSFLIHQVSTSSLLGNLGSWFVSMGMVYCTMKTFLTVDRVCSCLIESCVDLPTCRRSALPILLGYQTVRVGRTHQQTT